MLLNEIEILLAQTRLMELYLKQSQATAANESARIHEQYQAELVVLRSALTDKEHALAKGLSAGGEVEKNLRDQIRSLENRLGENHSLLESRDAELQSAKATTAGLHQRIADLENARQRARALDEEAAMYRQGLQAELLALRDQLQKNQDDFQTQQSISRGLQENLQTQLAQLQDQLEEKQAHSQIISIELERAKHEMTALGRQVTELQTSSHQARVIAAQELEQARARFESELAGLQAALATRDRNLHDSENAFAEIERSLKIEIIALRSQLEQRQELIEFRDDELRDTHGQLAALQQRVVELETSHDSIVANAEEIDLIRRSFESEIAALQQEIAFKERALSQRQEAATAVELSLHSKIQALQEELARSRSAMEQREHELQNARTDGASLRQQLGQLESAAATVDLSARQLAEEKHRSVELETELAQLRLEIAGLHEQSIQSELARRQLEENWQHAATQREELESRLQAKEDEQRVEQEQREAALRGQASQFRSVEDRLSAEIKSLRAQLEDRQRLWDQGHAELERLHSEIADLREGNSQSELSHRQIDEDRQRTVASQQELTASLQAKEQELSIAHATANELKSQFDAATGELQLQLAERGLLAQSRVMEIGNLKAEVQRLSEQLGRRESVASQATVDFYRETESSRAAHQAGLAALREEHRAKQQELENELGLEKQSATELRDRIQEVERRAGEIETALENRDQDFHSATSEAARLRARVRELETLNQSETAAARNEADQARMQSEAELAALRNDLQQKAWALAQQEATMEDLALAQRNQIQQLEAKLAEQQDSIKDRILDIERAQSQTHSLQRRIEELETELQHARLSGMAQAEQLRRQSVTQIDELNKQPGQKAAEIQENAMSQSTLEQSLRSEIDRLIDEAQERNQILQDRNDEVVRVKTEMDLLLDRFTQLESSASQAEAMLTGDSEQMRTEFQAQLALLQAELSQKEWALEERNATARGLEHNYLQEIESLRQQLAQKEIAKREDDRDFVLGEPQMQQGQNDAFQVADGVKSLDGHSNQSDHERRWHRGFGWKRRWKS